MNRHTLIQKLFHLIVVVSFFSATFLFTQPVSADGINPNPAAEQYLLSELRASGIVDLQWNFAEQDRGVSGEALLTALKDPEVQSKPLIYIASAVVTDDLWARDLIIPANLVFAEVEFDGLANFSSTQLQSVDIYDSTFLGDLDFGEASISRKVYIGNNTIGGSLSFLRAEIDGNTDLRDNTIEGSLNLYGAHVSGELLLDGSEVLGTEPMPGTSYPTEIWNTTVDGLVSFYGVEFAGNAYFFGSHFSRLDMTDTVFNGTVSFGETVVEQIADFSGAQFSKDADFENFSSGSDANFNNTVFQSVATFQNVSVGRDANFVGARFGGGADFSYFSAVRFVDFSDATFKYNFDFYYTTVAYPYFDGTVFNGEVTFEGMQASQDFELIDTSYNYAKEPFDVTLANVDGGVIFTNFTAPAGLLLSNSHFGSLDLTTDKNPDIQFVDLTGTEIDGDLSMEKVNVTDFLAEGLSVGGSTTLYETKIAEKLDLRNANIGFLKVDEQFTPPTDPLSFNLRGMTYSDIDLGDQGLTDVTWHGLLKFVNDSAYSPQAYQALSQFLTDKGHPNWAAEVELAQKRRERDEVLTRFSSGWFWSWFLDIFSGYGHRPAQAFIWSALVIVVGSVVFRRRDDMCPVDQDDVKLEYNPIWYSFALFLPYIDLGIASKWEPTPEKKWMRTYKYVHMMLGWILAPIALLTFGGIIG